MDNFKYKPDFIILCLDHYLEQAKDFYAQQEHPWPGLNHTDSFGFTAILGASWTAHSSEKLSDWAIVFWLLTLPGIDLNAQDFSGNSALHYACMAPQPEVIRAMVAAGANVALLNKAGQTPKQEFHRVCQFRGCPGVNCEHPFCQYKSVVVLL